jgi:glycosyltransferase involved in cell wall biosynthesis
VIPKLIQKDSTFELTVVGEVAKKLVPVPGTNFKGFVADLGALYAEACCAVCPIICGTGMSVKVIEAMAHGVPVVVLRNNSQESPVRHGIDGFIANNAEEFAHFTSMLFEDRQLCARMGSAARDAVTRNFSDDVVIQKLRDIIMNHQSAFQTKKSGIVIDGVIFQLQHGRPFGISRLWLSLLTELGKLPIGTRIILLDRAGTAPELPGIRKRNIGAYTIGTAQNEADVLDRLCTEEEASLFLSTYYTFTTATPLLLMLYDMIPERFDTVGPEASNPEWRDKYHAVTHASAFAAISMSTARDLVSYYPEVTMRPMAVVPCAVSETFRPHSQEEIAAFRAASGITKPYFLLVGRRDQHKNVVLFFRAFAKLANRADYALVMAGNTQPLEPDLREMAGDAEGYAGFFTDEALSLIYSGAVALVYPSRYEGFGLPILEAMQSGCPVITCQNSSLPEVAGSAALYVGEQNSEEMLQALQAVQQPEVREYLVKRGVQRAARFSWQDSAGRLVQLIEEVERTHDCCPPDTSGFGHCFNLHFCRVYQGLHRRSRAPDHR